MSGSEGSPLLLIHGWGFGPRVWDRVAQSLGSGARILAPALPGYDDDVTANAGVAPLDHLERILRQLDRPAVVAGWSLGGLLALQLAQAMPARIRALVMVASLPSIRRRDDWPAGIDASGLAAVRQQAQQHPEAALDYVAALSARGDPASVTVRRALRQAVPAVPRDEILLRDLDWIERTDLRHRPLPVTLHVMLGSRDQVLGDCAGTVRHWCLHGRVHVLRDSGHAPMIGRPDAVAGLLESLM